MQKHALRSWREDRKLTRSQLAKRLGVTAEAIRRYENGSRRPELVHLRAIARITGGAVRPDHFFA